MESSVILERETAVSEEEYLLGHWETGKANILLRRKSEDMLRNILGLRPIFHVKVCLKLFRHFFYFTDFIISLSI